MIFGLLPRPPAPAVSVPLGVFGEGRGECWRAGGECAVWKRFGSGLEAVWERFGNGFGAVSGMLVESEQLQTDSGQFPIVFGVEFLSASSEQFQGNFRAIPVQFQCISGQFQ